MSSASVVSRLVGGDVLGVHNQGRQPAAAAQLVERGVARDPEQPTALIAAAAVKGTAVAVGALERHRGHILGRGAVTQQRQHVGVDVVTAGAVERLEALPALALLIFPGRRVQPHTRTTPLARFHHALSVSLRGPSWKPWESSAGLSGDPRAGSPSTFSSASLRTAPRPARTCSASAASAGSSRASPAGTSVCSPLPPRSRYRTGSTADHHHLRARDPRRALGSFALGPRKRGAVGLRRVDGTENQRLLGAAVTLAQPLDRARHCELSTAEALDEVAAPRDPEHLELRQLRVDPAETAGHALGQHLLAREHAVALEQQLGPSTPARRRIPVLLEQRRGQRPAALDLRCSAAATR